MARSERALLKPRSKLLSVAPASLLPLLVGTLAITACFLWVVDLARPFVIDDAFISFRYAENLARGAGLVYNPGEQVEGYTNFLWVLLIAAVHALGGDSLTWAKILGTGANAVTLALVGGAAARWWPRPALPGLAFVPPLLLAVNFGFVLWGVGGLETALFVCLATAGLLRLAHELGDTPNGASLENKTDKKPEVGWIGLSVPAVLAALRRGPFPWAALLFALATLTRPDGVVLFAGALLGGAGWWLGAARAGMRPLGPGIAHALRSAILYGGIVGAHLLFRLAYYGDWVPNTVNSKVEAAGLFEIHLGRLEDWLRGWGLPAPQGLAGPATGLGLPPWGADVAALLLTPALWLAVVGLGAGRRRAWAWVLGGAAITWLAYLMQVSPDWMPGWRYFVPITPLMALLVAGGLDRLAQAARRLPGPGRPLLIGSLVGLVLALVLFSLNEVLNQQAPVVAGHAFIQAHYRAAGEYLRAHAPPDAVLAVVDAGAIPYYAGLVTVDYVGLADTHMAHVPYLPASLDKGDGVLRYYPFLRSDPAYLLSRRPDIVQLDGVVQPDGRYIVHRPELALVYQAMVQAGTYDTAHPVLNDQTIGLILVKRTATPWRP